MAHEHEWGELALHRPPPGLSAADFSLSDASGRRVRLGDFRGRAVLLNFWASWCTPCEMEMPGLERLHRRVGGRLAVLAVNFGEAAERVRVFGERHALTFPMLLDRRGEVFARYAVRALPFTLLLDRDGRPVAVAEGPRNWDAPAAVALFERLGRETR
jgi:thiol-disulfide isomerase/thioredoxin